MSTYGFVINVAGDSIAEMKRIEAAMASMGVKANVETKHVQERFVEMGEGIGGVFKNLKSLLLTGLGITALFEGWEFIEKSKEAFEGLEKAVARVDTVLKSTKFAAGFTSEDIQNQAKELSKGIVNKRDEILDAQGMLLSFHAIKGNTFKETMSAVTDFATFYKESLTDAALTVGKAINSPSRGMNRLQRQGVLFTEQQKEQIKNYETQGNLVAAQAVILKELNTEFGGQAKAFALTDAGKIQVASKQWEELQFKIGEIVSRVQVSLIPAFSKIVWAIKETFSSSIIQFFIEHLKDLVSLVLKLLPIWVAYKVIMTANAAITRMFAVENGILTVSMGELTVMTDGSTVAMEGFSAALTSTGIGALVVSLGLVIERMISLNSQLDETINKKYKLSESNDTFKEADRQFASIEERMNVFKSLGKQAQAELKTDLESYLRSIRDKIPVLNQRGNTLVNDANKLGNPGEFKRFMDNLNPMAASMPDSLNSIKIAGKTHDAMKDMSSNMKGLSKNFIEAKEYLKILSDSKIKGIRPSGSDGITGNAYTTSALAGAQGGLGEAKVINIHIGTMQKIEKVQGDNLDKAAQKAIEVMIRTINNLTYSQASM